MIALRLACALFTAAICCAVALSAAAAPASAHPRLNNPELRYSFENFLSLDDRLYFKVFVMSRDRSWAWSRKSSYENALREALNFCNAGSSFPGSCKVFAVGNDIVWDMSERERGELIAAYRKARTAANERAEDLPKLKIPKRGMDEYLSYPDAAGFKVLYLASDSAWSWAWRRTLEGAMRDALAQCKRASSTRQCELAAVGDTVVLGMPAGEKDAAVTGYGAGAGRLAPMSRSTMESYDRYRLHDEGHGFKAFFLGDDGAWSYRSLPSIEEAKSEGMKECRKHRRRGKCHLYALGNTIVWDMKKKELDDTEARYEELNLPSESLAPSDTGSFDGAWTGVMQCADCPSCNGAFEKRLTLTIANGRFELVPDLTYYGIGRVTAAGMVSVWSKRDFRFDGHAGSGRMRLAGQRGVRSCRITLERAP